MAVPWADFQRALPSDRAWIRQPQGHFCAQVRNLDSPPSFGTQEDLSPRDAILGFGGNNHAPAPRFATTIIGSTFIPVLAAQFDGTVKLPQEDQPPRLADAEF